MITFITGNENKARYFTEHIGLQVTHLKLDLDEIQSLDLAEVIEHKVRQAYTKIKTPVVVDDTSLEFVALGRLPGVFIKHFTEELSFENICSLLNNKDRRAIAKCSLGYFDGAELQIFTNQITGLIPVRPDTGNNGYGWDNIFIPDKYGIPASSLNKEDYADYYLSTKPFTQLKDFLRGRV